MYAQSFLEPLLIARGGELRAKKREAENISASPVPP